MSTAIIADSFTSISNIAANPPARPSEFPQHHHGVLTLYITRVPGSRDVFLTPLKPRERIVTAQDVQSSLYYVHINSIDDIELLHNPERTAGERLEARINTANHGPSIAPNARSSMYEYDQERVPALPRRPQAAPALPPRPMKITRKPVTTNVANTLQHAVVLPVLPPRPLPPLPDENASSFETNGHDAYDQDEKPSHLHRDLGYPLTPIETARHEGLDGTLTLVRREPSTSDQWNVATIYDLPLQEVTSRSNSGLAKARIKKSGAPLYIDITNAAYLAFRSDQSNDKPVEAGTFRRRLYLPGSSSIDLTTSRAYRTESANSRNSADRPSLDMRRNGYCFKSPWGGDCQFTTTPSGRSLICKHALAAQQTTEVSELRFNLPVSAKDEGSPQDRRRSYFADGRRHSRIDLVRGLVKKTDVGHLSPDGSLDDLDAPDFSLGHELAGGGFGGRQPKLGKLIIHPAGLAMLDLLVAANIGLWWRAWEKVG